MAGLVYLLLFGAWGAWHFRRLDTSPETAAIALETAILR
jgi:hypothetical protein